MNAPFLPILRLVAGTFGATMTLGAGLIVYHAVRNSKDNASDARGRSTPNGRAR